MNLIRNDYQLDELGGIPWEWWKQVSLACDMFFIRRGMNPKGPALKEIMHQEAHARKEAKKAK